jgi:endonuclease/exonuclease/phosphatase family metal-dependent hydrolase
MGLDTERHGAVPSFLRIAVASYNVHGGVGHDGRRDIARIARVVSALEADIVALQEVDGGVTPETGDPVELLARATGLMAVRGPTMKRPSGDYGNVVLTRFAPRTVRFVDLSFRAREPRGALDLDIPVPGGPLRIIATHLGLFPNERRYQVKRIIERVRTGAAGDESATLLMGDINEWFALGRPLRWLNACFQGRAWGGRTFPSRWPIFALDRIWVHPKGALTSYRIHDTPEARAASDHLPVRAEIAIPVAASARLQESDREVAKDARERK